MIIKFLINKWNKYKNKKNKDLLENSIDKNHKKIIDLFKIRTKK